LIVRQSVQPTQWHDNNSSRDDGHEIGPHRDKHQILANDGDEHNKGDPEQGAKPPDGDLVVRSLQDIELIPVLLRNLARVLDRRPLLELLEALFDLRPAKEQHPNEGRRVRSDVEEIAPQLLSAYIKLSELFVRGIVEFGIRG
jgi:hypothetical protein